MNAFTGLDISTSLRRSTPFGAGGASPLLCFSDRSMTEILDESDDVCAVTSRHGLGGSG